VPVSAENYYDTLKTIKTNIFFVSSYKFEIIRNCDFLKVEIESFKFITLVFFLKDSSVTSQNITLTLTLRYKNFIDCFIITTEYPCKI